CIPSTVKAPRCASNRARHTARTLFPGCRIGRSFDEMPPRTRPRWRPCRAVISSSSVCASPWRRTPSTMPSSVHSILFLRKLQILRAVALGIVLPAFAHFHVQEQMHLLFDRLFDLLARLHRNRLDHPPALAQHDLPLALALDKNRLFDPHRTVAQLFPRIGLDRRLIG